MFFGGSSTSLVAWHPDDSDDNEWMSVLYLEHYIAFVYVHQQYNTLWHQTVAVVHVVIFRKCFEHKLNMHQFRRWSEKMVIWTWEVDVWAIVTASKTGICHVRTLRFSCPADGYFWCLCVVVIIMTDFAAVHNYFFSILVVWWLTFLVIQCLVYYGIECTKWAHRYNIMW